MARGPYSRDSDTLSRLWADDLEVAVPKLPVMKKGELIKLVDSGRMKLQRYETSDLNFRIYGQSAVVTGRLLRKREINGREIEDDWRFKRCINGLPIAGELFPSTHPKPRPHENRHPYVSALPRLLRTESPRISIRCALWAKAWCQRFSDGNPSNHYTDDHSSVRLVR